MSDIPKTDVPTLAQAEIRIPAKPGIWKKLGGGALTVAILFHLILVLVGAFWIFQIIHEPEKKVDFMPGDGNAGGSERGIQHQMQQKRRAQITPSTNVKRVFAEGAMASYSIPEQGDSFGEMSALSSLGSGGMSGGLGGSGGGKGFGNGLGAGAGGLGPGGATLFGIQMEDSRKVAVVMDVSRSMTKYLPIVAKELDKLAARGPLILYFGCGLKELPSKGRLDDDVRPASGTPFDSFWQNWQGKTPLNLPLAERKKLEYDPKAKMPLEAIHKQMSNRLDTYFIDFNGIFYTQSALLCDEIRDADTIYWFADFQDKSEKDVMKDVLRKLKSRRQKLYMHATMKGKAFEEIRDGLCIPSGGKATVKGVK
jgi:hypothetical protein